MVLGIAEGSKSHGIGLDDDDSDTLASILHQPLLKANRGFVLLSLDYEEHDDIQGHITEIGFWTFATGAEGCFFLQHRP